MSFPRYPKYKDSGVEWLGQVPEHWGVRKIRWLFEIKKRIADELGFDVFSITQQGIRVKDLDSNDGQISMDYSKYQLVEVGDFAMNHMDLLTGGVDIAATRGVTSPDYRVCTTRDYSTCHDRFFLGLFQMCYRNKIFYGFGQGSSQLGRWRMPTEQFNDFVFPLPPLAEQTAIAAFLDRETEKIDALVAEQRRLMELLKEKRQAVISHAVTRGLNPAAPLKPSGIEWLGDVPAHWKVSRLKHATSRIVDCPHETPTLTEGGDHLTIRTSDIDQGAFFPDRMRAVDETEYFNRIRREPLLRDDIVYSREGGRWGHAALVPEEGRFCLGQRMMQFRASTQFVPDFLMWHLNTKNVYVQGDVDTVGAASPHVNVETIRNYRIVAPPFAEQADIVAYLKNELSKFDTLTAEAQRAIDLLQERRTALISAAVTGQIDVRHLAEPKAA
jgi:type I restriction enzyme S subunit